MWDDAMLPYAVVAVADGVVVGFASARPTEDALELEDLFTDPKWKRHGVASALIDHVAEAGRSAGAARVEVSTPEHARAFYESAGFTQVGMGDTEGGPVPRMHFPLWSGQGTESVP